MKIILSNKQGERLDSSIRLTELSDQTRKYPLPVEELSNLMLHWFIDLAHSHRDQKMP